MFSSVDSIKPSQKVCPESQFGFPSDLKIIRQLAKQKFTVYLAKSECHDMLYALKVFNFKGESPCSLYQNEKAFLKFQNKNIIFPLYTLDKKITEDQHLQRQRSSLILSEYAPFGSLHEALTIKEVAFNEKMIRTFFHQIVEGVEYLHSNGIVHLDMKLQNIMLSSKFSAKIIDFDLAFHKETGKIKSRGTLNFRAPEMCLKDLPEIPEACDLYSLGVILFVLRSRGTLPFKEAADDSEKKMKSLLQKLRDVFDRNPVEFWQSHLEMQKFSKDRYSKDFKLLIEGLLRKDPKQRFTLEDIKANRWYNQPIMSQEEMRDLMEPYFKREIAELDKY